MIGLRRLWLFATLLLAACGASEEKGMNTGVEQGGATDIAAVNRFLGAPLPPGATAVRVASEAGIDRLVLLRFDAPAAAAADYAQQLLGAAPVLGADPRLSYLGGTHDWWLAQLPAGASGGEATRPSNQVIKLVMAPAAGGTARVWVAAFAQ